MALRNSFSFSRFTSKIPCDKKLLLQSTLEHDFLTTKFWLWIGTCSSNDNTFRGKSRAVKKCGILNQIEKTAESRYVFNLEDAVAHLAVSNPSEILAIEK